MIPVDYLRSLFRYEPSTGAIYRRGQKSRRRAGHVREDGYRVIKVPYQGRRVQIMAHRLAYILHHGRHPEHEVDHRDTNRLNNRPDNLREATRAQQIANRRTPGKYPKGVVPRRTKNGYSYAAVIRINSKKTHLGTYPCPQQAHARYMSEARKLYGGFARP